MDEEEYGISRRAMDRDEYSIVVDGKKLHMSVRQDEPGESVANGIFLKLKRLLDEPWWQDELKKALTMCGFCDLSYAVYISEDVCLGDTVTVQLEFNSQAPAGTVNDAVRRLLRSTAHFAMSSSVELSPEQIETWGDTPVFSLAQLPMPD